MRKLIMFNAITLDGYFEGEKPWDLDFHNLVFNEEFDAMGLEQLKSADMLVFGRATYEGMYDYWRKETDETAKYMNSLPKLVCSKTLSSVEWENSELTDDPINKIKSLKEQGDGDMFVFGSSILSETFINEGLFDEYRLVVAPVILGKGRKLFSVELKYQELNLLETKTFKNGAVVLKYAKK